MGARLADIFIGKTHRADQLIVRAAILFAIVCAAAKFVMSVMAKT